MLGMILMSLVVMTAQQQASVTIVQETSGWCSPAIANVVASVAVNCIGVDARALKRLNEQLSGMKLDREKTVQVADEWATWYKELEARLSEAGDDTVLSRQVEEYLHEGELEKAGAILDQILGSEEIQIDRTAANHYNRALVFELQFRALDALPHLEKAYGYRPDQVKYGQEYSYVLLKQNDFQRAEPVLLATLDRARRLSKSNPAANQQGVAVTLSNLANLYRETERPKEAESAYQEALGVDRQLAKANPAAYQPDVAATLDNLANLYRDTQRLKEAEAAYHEALEIYRQLAKVNPAAYQEYVATTVNNLANLYSETERPKEAESAYREALEIDRQLAKANPAAYQPDVAMTLGNLANLYSDTQRLKEAEAAYQEALEIYRQLAKVNPVAYQRYVATTLNNMAILYSDTQRLKQAEAAYREALEIDRQLAKANPAAYQPEVAMTLDNLANLYGYRYSYSDTQRLKEAEAAYQEALEIYRQLGKMNPSAYQRYVATTLNNLANLYNNTHRMKEAETGFQEALEIRRQLAKLNPAAYRSDVATTLYNLAILYTRTQRLKEAEASYQETLDIYRQVAKANPAAYEPHVAATLNDLANVYRHTQRLKEAEAAYEEALDICRQLAKANPAAYQGYVATTLDNLANLYSETERPKEAESAYQEALEIDRQLTKANPAAYQPDIAETLTKLAILHLQTGNLLQAAEESQEAVSIERERWKTNGAVAGDDLAESLMIASMAQKESAIKCQLGGEAASVAQGSALKDRIRTQMAACPDAQEGSAQEAEQLSAQVVKLYGQGRYREAIPLAQRELAIGENVLGPEHPDTATALSNLAGLYFATGAHAKAEPLYQRALAIREKVLGPDHPDTALSLSNLASVYYATGAYAKAEPLLQRALAITEKALGPEHADIAISLNNLAELYKATGAYAKAEPLLQRALAITEKALGPEHPDTALSLNNLAKLYDSTGAYAKAEPLLQRALTITEKVLGADHPDTARSLNSLAELYEATGAYAKAEPLYQRALAIREYALGPEHPTTVASLSNLALLYQATGAYAKAEPLLLRAFAIDEKTVGPKDPKTGTALNNLAGLYYATGAYAKAEPLYLSALAILEKTVGPEDLDTSKTLNNLALLYYASGDYPKAESLLRRALAIREKALGPEHPVTATALNNLAELYQATGAYAEAEPLYQRVLAIFERALGPEHPDTAILLHNLADLHRATGAYAKAELLLHRAQVIEEANTARFLLSGSEARKQAYLQKGVWYAYTDVSFSLANPTARGTALGLTSVLQYKGRVLDAVSDSSARLRRSVGPQDQALFDQLSGVAQELSTLTFRGPGNLSSQAYQQRLNELAEQQEKLEAELSSRSAALRQAVTPITLESVRQALPADAVLVEWFRYKPFDPKAKVGAHWGAPRYAVYVLKRSGEPVVIDLGAAQPIEDLVAEFRTALSDPANTYFKEVGEELYGKLMKPLHPHLAQSERLLLSPDGGLNLLPFAALVDEHGEYLAQHFELTYLTSGRDLLRMATESPSRGSAVVLADPDYGPSAGGGAPFDSSLQPARSGDLDRSGLVFKPLPGTAAEAKALQSLLKLDAQNVLTGDRATEARLRELHGPRILHVATHGFFLNDQEAATVLKPVGFGPETFSQPLGENPLLRSGLALAGANARHSGATDDGILTAAEAAQLDLLGTQLVVLSACETGVGTVQTVEGVYGLRRALVLAGAEAQLASLWKVADTATQELMVDYYQRLLKGEGRSGALRAMQKAMIENPERQHPYYWAAFIPIGNWTPLTKDQ